jgi:hypothetical protein
VQKAEGTALHLVMVARAVVMEVRGATVVPGAKVEVRDVKADQVAVLVDHVAASVNISAKRKFASSAWKRWT